MERLYLQNLNSNVLEWSKYKWSFFSFCLTILCKFCKANILSMPIKTYPPPKSKLFKAGYLDSQLTVTHEKY